MKENLTSINVIIDSSGSMNKLANDTIEGFNAFLAEQKLLPGEATISLTTFNTNVVNVYNQIPIQEASPLTSKNYSTLGGTALLDAVGTAIDSLGNKLSLLKEEEKPSKVLFLIMTDGEENSSREYSKEKIKNMVSHQQDKYNWAFVFVGANIDSFLEGASIGMNYSNTMNFAPSSEGVKEIYDSMSRNTSKFRSSKESKSVDFFDDK